MSFYILKVVKPKTGESMFSDLEPKIRVPKQTKELGLIYILVFCLLAHCLLATIGYRVYLKWQDALNPPKAIMNK